MAQPKKVVKEIKTPSKTDKSNGISERLQGDIDIKQSYLNLILGALIVLVIGVLTFNYFNRSSNDLAPQITEQAQETVMPQTGDVSPENLPGKYTVKEGDTLYTIAEQYYGDGFKFEEIVRANSMANANTITAGQIIDIPRIQDQIAGAQSQNAPNDELAQASLTPTPTPSVAPTATPTLVAAQATPAAATTAPTATAIAQNNQTQPVQGGTGGAENQTVWGEAITGTTYTVQEGDWLSKIAGRAYGDIMQYQKIAQANNITNPDVITPGTVIQIPR